MNFNQIGTYYPGILSQRLDTNSYFLMRLTELWGEECLESSEEENLSSNSNFELSDESNSLTYASCPLPQN
ncbi:hypothetical protein [Crocosphaera sp. Alani8]|uniref:hypothetical protein n=1 Tax=Crocosphaera sp. Alani8 TaxID=3038952 RepID=UPI00313BE59D